MFKIINFEQENNISFKIVDIGQHLQYTLDELKTNANLADEFWDRTLAGIGTGTGINSSEILDLEKRSSWTHKSKFRINPSIEMIRFFDQNDILYGKHDISWDYYNLIKYKQGDFFLTHGDRNLSDALEGIIHKYTSLLFCPYDTYEGGELIFTHPEELYEIKFNPRIETNNGKFVMIIFSIDMLHKVLPIISGTRCVFKKPLFVKSDSNIIKKENNYKDCVDTLDDGGWTCTSGGGGGDY